MSIATLLCAWNPFENVTQRLLKDYPMFRESYWLFLKTLNVCQKEPILQSHLTHLRAAFIKFMTYLFMELFEMIIPLRDEPLMICINWGGDLDIINLRKQLSLWAKAVGWVQILILTLVPSILLLLTKSKTKIGDCFMSCNLGCDDVAVFIVLLSSNYSTV